MVNAQEWLDEKYPNKEEVKVIEGWRKEISGELIIADFPQLEKINVGGNQLTQLHLKNCPQLTHLDCSDNKFTELTIINCPNLQIIYAFNNQLANLDCSNNQQLEILRIGYNNFSFDLSFYRHLVNLKRLFLRNNNFTGSLEPLRNLHKLEHLGIENTKISQGLEYLPESVKGFYCQGTELAKELEPFAGDIEKWREKKKNKWKENGFAEKEIKEWMAIGLNIDECELANYLKKERNLTPWETENNLTELRKECKIFLAAKQSEETINKFIQEAKIEKIPYEKLNYAEYLAEGGFGKIYRAEWEDKNIILKSLNNSCELTPEFLQEIASHKLFDNNTNKIVKCYGISQDPQGNYIMVMDYVRGGNLREYLQRNNHKLDFKKKLIQLHSIAEGLSTIHQQGLIHKDFHSGNILSGGYGSFFADLKCYITDLGLSRPANEKGDTNIYGVMPYVAPEVLKGKKYTQKSDIYSLGMVAYEILVGHPPFFNQAYSTSLATKICRGLRPEFQIKIPRLLEELINQCWDNNPSNRSEASEITETLNRWQQEINNPTSDIYRQCQEAKENNKTLPEEIRYPTYKLHAGAALHSKLINTKQITKKLDEISKSVGIVEISDDYGEEDKVIEKTELITQLEREKINFANLQQELDKIQQELNQSQTRIQQLKTRVEELEQKEQQAQIQIPPKSN